jgi:hypothetical protein
MRMRKYGWALLILLGAGTVSGQLVISEFRLHGRNGSGDEFIEIQNNTNAPVTVASPTGSGYAIAASDFAVRCIIPNGTIFPPRGHFLCANTSYSLAAYAAPDATYSASIGDTAGIALFNTNLVAFFSTITRLDAVGSTSEINAVYKEGGGYPAFPGPADDFSWLRDPCGKQGSTSALGPCPSGGFVVDTNNNAADFILVDTLGPPFNTHLRGAPGPENRLSPIYDGASIPAALLDPCASAISTPNSVRDFTSDPANNSTFGTLDLRQTFTNSSGASLTRLRFRVVDLSTFPPSAGFADLRVRGAPSITATVDRPPCGTGSSVITVQGTTLEVPGPTQQMNGGGVNSSLSAGTVTLATPLLNGATIDVRFLFGVQQTGTYKLGMIVEALPNGGNAVVEFSGNTEVVPPSVVSITRLDPSPTTLMAVRFLVTFSEPVTGVDATDFALITGIPGAAITGVTGGGTTWTVTVSTSAGNGTIRLDLIDNDSIVDADPTPLGGPGAGNGNFTAGEVYTIGAVNVPALDPRLLVLLAVVLMALALRNSS